MSQDRSTRATRTLLAGRSITGPVSARVTLDGREYINFSGSGYLALAGVPDIRSPVLRALEQGAPFAQQLPAALGAVDPAFDSVERAGAAVLGTETSVYFASGYFIGLVGLANPAQSFDLFFIDENAHYSLKDAALMSGIPTHAFTHCDVQSLDETLKRYVRARQRPLVITDGVFATTGRMAPLAEYSAILASYDGRLFIDESHSFGVVGENGRGAAEYCGVEHLATRGSTLSKAFCAQGAILGCSAAARDTLRTIPPIRGACAGSPLSAIAATASLSYVAERPGLRQSLSAMSQFFRGRLRQRGLEVIDTPAPIVAFRWGAQADMLELQRRAFERGIYLYYSTYIGAGPDGMIRCAVYRDHTREDIEALISTLG